MDRKDTVLDMMFRSQSVNRLGNVLVRDRWSNSLYGTSVIAYIIEYMRRSGPSVLSIITLTNVSVQTVLTGFTLLTRRFVAIRFKYP